MAKPKKGFTLIELLVVIAIIALLMSIMMPALAKVKDLANSVVCLSNIKQWCIVFALYVELNNGNFCADYPTGPEDLGGHAWPDALQPLYNNRDPRMPITQAEEKDLRFCPVAKKPAARERQQAFIAWSREDELDPTIKQPYGSYGLNSWASNPPSGTRDLGLGRLAEGCWRSPTVKHASEVPLFLDSRFVGGFPENTDRPPEYDGHVILEGDEIRRYSLSRHSGGTINGCFVDFSGRKIGLKELWRLRWSRFFDVQAPLPDWPPWMRKFRDYE